MKTWIYSWIIYPIIFSIAYVIGNFNQKIRRTLKLRSWRYYLSLRSNVGIDIEYWIHVASQGELEYAIPIIEEFSKYNKKVLVTYYSISAKESVEKLSSQYSNVSLVVPLPHDGLGLMRDFVKLLKKQGVKNLLLMKYELWPGLLWECNSNRINVLLVNALKPGWFHSKLLHKLYAIISGYESELLNIDHPNKIIAGDTRVVRVKNRIEKSILHKTYPKLFSQLNKNRTIVLGSMWPKDTEVIMEALTKINNINVVWVPHELDIGILNKTEILFKKNNFDTVILENDNDIEKLKMINQKTAILINKKGFLSEIYKIAKLAYVGGGFGKCIHSVWEPAINNCFVLCGPNIDRAPEAQELKRINILENIKNSNECLKWLEKHLDEKIVFDMSALSTLMSTHFNAPKVIVDYCLKESSSYGKS